MKMNKAVNRLRGSMPKVGIRPTIDGRRNGVRESLEEQTMNMAKSAAKLISENLKHPNGLPVECVIADTTIGGFAEAADCADKFKRENVGVSLTVTPCWCYGSETMDTDPHMPKAVWGFNGTERPGAVYLAAVLAGYTQKGLPAFGIYGRDVQDSDDTSVPNDVKGKILDFAKAGLAVAYMKDKSYLSLGNVSMGIAGSIVDQDFFLKYLGVRTETVDMVEFMRRIDEEIYDKEEYEKAMKWVAEFCKVGKDDNPADKQRTAEQKQEDWETSVKMTLIARDLMVGNPKLAEIGYGEEAMGRNAIAGGFQGQRQWTDYKANGDFMETMLNTSFDWNGIREPYVMATENDSLNAVPMLFGHLLSDRAQIFSDVRTYWSPEAIERVTGWKPEGLAEGGLIHLINSGSTTLDGSGAMSENGEPVMKPWWDVTEEDAKNCLDATLFRPADTGYFRGGGYSTDFLTKGGMPVTMSRVNLVNGLGPVLQIAEGFTAEIPANVHDTLDDRTNPTWPTTWFAPRLTGEGNFRDVYAVMANWGANHGAISYGHIGAQLITLASMLRIPVSMHNVPEEKIFRPSAWASFGMDREGADYRACANFGPLYK
ncbi:L-fucose isomerase [Spirochaeta isovalerica]|uniref:L-fucose isomerase n=1 Tax=Spirochaeta isovalerica TaxID=150 RepID=A0A841R9T1_9SPIO|nr:L-fucose isomerase [Spirochaeta isovalerica]MBB6480665.1 L-fucose isomerase [Spirochaeta isovalerica]